MFSHVSRQPNLPAQQDRRTAGHRFHGADAKVLLKGIQHKEVGLSQGGKFGLALQPSWPVDERFGSRVLDDAAQSTDITRFAIPGDYEMPWLKLALSSQVEESFQQQIYALFWMQA